MIVEFLKYFLVTKLFVNLTKTRDMLTDTLKGLTDSFNPTVVF